MFKGPAVQRSAIKIDLASVRDTLTYIESDLNQSPELQRLAVAVRSALTEIKRLEQSDLEFAKPDFAASRFVAARLDL